MTTPLGPWPLGIDNISDRAALPADENGRTVALRDAANVNIDRKGRAARRAGHALALSMPGLCDLWSGRRCTLARAGTQLYQVDASALDPIATLNSADPCSYADLNDSVVVGNRTTLLTVRGGDARALGAPDAPPPVAMADEAGGLDPGRYAVAVAFVAGNEVGGLSPLRFVDVPAGGGIALSGLPVSSEATSLRIYRTRTNGAELHLVTELPVGSSLYLLGNSPLGDVEQTRNLRRMPPGEHVAAWNGRLLVAHGRVLRFSESMRYGLYSPRHGFVQFADRITMLAPVEAGVFVGTTKGVVFLRGRKPHDWTHDATGALPPAPGSATMIASRQTTTEAPGQRMALWLAPNGLVMGTEQGAVVELQASRITLPAYARGALCVHDRRVTAAVT